MFAPRGHGVARAGGAAGAAPKLKVDPHIERWVDGGVQMDASREEMSKLFVGGIAWATSDDGLREAFEAFGDVTEAKIITDRETGRSRGFGFVTFTTSEAAEAAIEGMNGQSLDGRTLIVNEARERRGGGGGGGGGRRHGGGGGGRY